MIEAKLYRTWNSMRNRTGNKNDRMFYLYGGKGIKICKRWKFFKNFRDDMHKSFLKAVKLYGENNVSIDRIDGNGNYKPSNCRWANPMIQANNRSTNVNITYKGETHTLAEWARKLGILEVTLRGRFKKKWTLEEKMDIHVAPRNTKITYRNQSLTIKEWSKITGIKIDTLGWRIFRMKWPIKKALTKKPNYKFRNPD